VRDDWREIAELLLRKSEISGKVLSSGMKTVERDPLLDWLLLLSMERIVWIEPVGERVRETKFSTRIGG
jgi:hypothetical protein